MKRIAAAAAIGLLALSPVDGRAEPPTDREQFEIRHYAVSGDNAEALRRAIDASGPAGPDGARWAGRTDWTLHYRFWTRSTGGPCRVERVSVTLATVMTLPEWAGAPAASPPLQQRWARFLSALRVHEEGHRRHGQLGADELERRLATLPPHPDCPAMDAAVRPVADEIIARHAAMGPAYDRTTDHGRRQGAVFP